MLVDGLPDRELLSTEARSCLKRLYHPFICFVIWFIAEGLMNLLDSLQVGITQPLAELNAVTLIDVLRHVA